MNRLYFVRHGESWSNINKQFSYRKVDLSLTPKGILQAQQAAEFFADKAINSIYASPMKRTTETAAILANYLGLTVISKENFREINTGDLEGKPLSPENWAFYSQAIQQWFYGQSEYRFPGGEDYFTLWNRTRDGLISILANKTEQNIVLVGHAGIFAVTLKDICTNIDIKWLSTAEMHNCSITELEIGVQDGVIAGKLISWASYEHLSGQAAELVAGLPLIVSPSK